MSIMIWLFIKQLYPAKSDILYAIRLITRNSIKLRMPRSDEIRRIPIKQDTKWKWYTLTAGFFFLLSAADTGCIYGFGVSRPRMTHRNSSRYFPLELIGGLPAPRLDEPTLSHSWDSTGYFKNEETGKDLDVGIIYILTCISQLCWIFWGSICFFRLRMTIKSKAG